MGSIVDGAMAVMGIMAGLLMVIGSLKSSETANEPAYQTVTAEKKLRNAA